MISSPLPTLICVSIYVMFVYGGQKWMKSRPAFDLKNVMMIYNFCLVLLNAYICYEFVMTTLLNPGFSLICQPMDYTLDYTSVRFAKVCWLFYFSKLIELLDTVFFVLRKKNNQISFLHVYHHTTMPLLWWVGVRFVPGGEAYFSASINSFIHVLMYTYYLLSAMGPQMQKYLWWKKYMTTLQLFWMIMFHTSYAIYTDCGFPKAYMYALIAYTLSHILLFSNFYYQTYTKKARMKREQEREVQSNGHMSNGLQQKSVNKSSAVSNGFVKRRSRKD
ncbi:hypothetical protein KUTeg_023377 [Tegillarca granosa]|uniref:Elongation of very long chain fatty acids protein n=1 Tax=Tegillarca granosa TaxID=220873 RepID=A0ABQ9E216_TEGGR|nr:hypothetical protein KUTeg_023377 [Tegillarca granosa]